MEATRPSGACRRVPSSPGKRYRDGRKQKLLRRRQRQASCPRKLVMVKISETQGIKKENVFLDIGNVEKDLDKVYQQRLHIPSVKSRCQKTLSRLERRTREQTGFIRPGPTAQSEPHLVVCVVLARISPTCEALHQAFDP